MKTIGFIGGGNMGAAIISRACKQFKILVCEKDKKRAAFLKRKFKVVNKDLASMVNASDVIVLAVKPQDFDGVLDQIKGAISSRQVVISIAAGITSAFIEKKLGGKVRVIRTMPNMPAQVGEGITAVAKGKYAKNTDVALARKIFNCVGATVIVQEKMIDAVTAVSGSGPAYVFYFVECLLNAAQSLGFSKDVSKDLVMATLLGSAHLLDQQKEDAASLRAKVTSKGGTTQAAMDVLMKNKVDKIFSQALKAAQKRAKQLAE